MRYDKFDECRYSRKFEGCSMRIKEMLDRLASSLYRINVACWEIHELRDGLWDVEIEFFNSKGSRNFQQQYEIHMKASAEKLKKEGKMKDKEVKTTTLKVQDAYRNAECDETRETLKKVFPDAFEEEYRFQNVTHELTWGYAGEKTEFNDAVGQNLLYYAIDGYHLRNGVNTQVIRLDGVGVINLYPKEYHIEHNSGFGFAVLRKEKI